MPVIFSCFTQALLQKPALLRLQAQLQLSIVPRYPQQFVHFVVSLPTLSLA